MMFIPFYREFQQLQLQQRDQPQPQLPVPRAQPPRLQPQSRQALRDGRDCLCHDNPHLSQQSASAFIHNSGLEARSTVHGGDCVHSESMAAAPVRDDRRIVLHLVSFAIVFTILRERELTKPGL